MKKILLQNNGLTTDHKIEFRGSSTAVAQAMDATKVISDTNIFGTCLGHQVDLGTVSSFDYLIMEYQYVPGTGGRGLSGRLLMEKPFRRWIVGLNWLSDNAGYSTWTGAGTWQGWVGAEKPAWLINFKKVLADNPNEPIIRFYLGAGWDNPTTGLFNINIKTYRGGDNRIVPDRNETWYGSDTGAAMVNIGGELVNDITLPSSAWWDTYNAQPGGNFWLRGTPVGYIEYNQITGRLHFTATYNVEVKYDSTNQALSGIAAPNSTVTTRTPAGVIVGQGPADANGQWAYSLDVTKLDHDVILTTSCDQLDMTRTTKVKLPRELKAYNPITDVLTVKIRPNTNVQLVNQNNDVVATTVSDATGMANLTIDPTLKAASTTLRFSSTDYNIGDWPASSVLAKPLILKVRSGVSIQPSCYISFNNLSYNSPPMSVVFATKDSMGRVSSYARSPSEPWGTSVGGPTTTEQPGVERWCEVYVITDFVEAYADYVYATDVTQFSEVLTNVRMNGGNTIYSMPAVLPPNLQLTRMFNGGRINDASALSNLAFWNTSHVKDTTFAFSGTLNFAPPIGNWDMSNVTNMASMFYNAVGWGTDISTWNTGKVTGMANMFQGSNFNYPIGNWNTSSVTDMSYMFNNNTVFNQDLSGWNTANVTTMISMFSGCTAFNGNVSTWNTGKVGNMEALFMNCAAFNQSLENWNVSASNTFAYMFKGCAAFNQPLTNWDTVGVARLTGMFDGATVFNQPLAHFKTKAVMDYGYMFQNAKAFNQPIGVWNTKSIYYATYMFNGATTFNQDLSQWCTPWLSSKPASFDTGSPLVANTAYLPVWGTCPRGENLAP